MKLPKNEWIILSIIILVGLLLRLYHFPQNFYYTMDEEVMNLIQRNIVLGHHYPLIGSVSPLGTYLLPYFYYLGSLILSLSNLNPLGQGFFGILIGLFNIFLIYQIGKKLFNKNIGLISSIIYSSSFLIILFDRRWWHLSLGPLLSLLVLYSLFEIKKGKLKFIYLLLGALTLGWSTDYTNLILFLFTIVVWVLFKLPVWKKEVGLALLIFLFLNFPLVIFDLRHDFLNTNSFISYLTKHKTATKEGEALQGDRETLGKTKNDQAAIALSQPFITFSRIFYIFSDLDIAKQHTYCKDYILDRNKLQGWVLPAISILIILGLFVITYKRRKEQDSFGYKLISTFIVTFISGISFYGYVFKGDIFEHYLATLLPTLVFATSIFFYQLLWEKYKFVLFLLLTLMIFLNIYLLTNSYNSLGFNYKLEAVKYTLTKVGDADFSLDSLGSCFKWDGYYYPFLLSGRHPVKSYQDPNYSWLFDYKVSEQHPKNVVVFVSKGDYQSDNFTNDYNRYQKWVVDRQKFGGLEVLILDNSKGDFR